MSVNYFVFHKRLSDSVKLNDISVSNKTFIVTKLIFCDKFRDKFVENNHSQRQY